MRKLYLPVLFLGILLGSSQVFGQSHRQQKKYFPKEVRNIFLGMPMEDFAKARPQMAPGQLSREKIRYRWKESFPDKSPLLAAVYYFGNEGERPLYEIVLFYRDLSDRGQWVRKKLGSPNFNDREWKLSSAEGFVIRAWLHDEKLIFAAELEGTEWGNESE